MSMFKRFGAVGLMLLSAGTALRAPHRENPLVGTWYQSGWALCKPAAKLPRLAVGKMINELRFAADDTFSVTWQPFEGYKDYWGTYRYDLARKTIELRIEGRNYSPEHFNGKGNFRLDSDDTHLTLSGVRLGTKDATTQMEICEWTFTRS